MDKNKNNTIKAKPMTDVTSRVLAQIFSDGTPVSPEVYNFAKECVEMIQLYNKKNHDYGNSFERGMNVIGLPYGVGRLYDKMNRIITLMKVKAEVDDESMSDTIRDLGCYSVMLYSYLNNPRTTN